MTGFAVIYSDRLLQRLARINPPERAFMAALSGATR
jgi:hypothetical protein